MLSRVEPPAYPPACLTICGAAALLLPSGDKERQRGKATAACLAP
jgi:hypothetical protein